MASEYVSIMLIFLTIAPIETTMMEVSPVTFAFLMVLFTAM